MIGVGDFGRMHIEVLKDNPDVNLLTICARTEEKLRRISKEYSIPKWSTSVEEVMQASEIDAVVIATTEETHFKFTKMAVENNKHVLLEKPVCLDPLVGGKLIELDKATDRIILPGHILRYDAAYNRAKQIIASGEMGKIFSIRVKRNVPIERFSLHSRTHPVFMALAHDIDIILWLTGDDVKKVYALSRKTDLSYNNPDVFFGLIEMKNGVVCNLETQWTLPNEYGQYLDTELEVMTAGGNIKLKYPGDGLKVMKKGNLHCYDLTLWPKVNGRMVGALANEIDYFIRLIKGIDKEQIVTVEEAVRGIKIGHMLIKSSDEGKVIENI
ncbi:MAG: hypothetical protein PWP27_1639 [Clostridiales bacterium]|nr:hypothetical protein [Clostridiales bacterium]